MVRKILLILLVPASFLLASGFSIYEQGSRATGMAGAFMARANEPSAIFYNPAGIAGLKGWQLQVGTTAIQPQFSFTGPLSMDQYAYNKAKKGLFFPSHLYATYTLNPNISFGLGIYSPFGMATTWQDKWVGRLLATNTELRTVFFNPVVAYKIRDNLSVAAGISLVNANVVLEKDVLFTPRHLFGHSKLEANTNGFGFNMGIHYRLCDKAELGIVYRSPVQLDFNDGKAYFTFPVTQNDIVNQEIAAYFPAKTKATSAITLPASYGLGVAYEMTPNLSFEFDYLVMGWHSYDEVKITFADPVAGQTENVNPRNYKDSFSLRFGLEYRLDTHLTLRAGYAWDSHAVPSAYVEPTLPENDRHNYTIGLGYHNRHFSVDAAYHILLQDDRQVENTVSSFDGSYAGLANIAGLTFGYAF